MSSLNEEETDGDDSRPASRKPSAQTLSVMSNNGGSSSSRGSVDFCSIRNMKIKERSCSERSDSGFSECANHSSGTCTCEKKGESSQAVSNGSAKEAKKDQSIVALEVNGSPPLNHKLLKNKLERIASLQFDEEENIVVSETTQEMKPESVITIDTTAPVTTEISVKSAPVVEPAPSVPVSLESRVDALDRTGTGSKLDLLTDRIKSELDYDIKRYHLDGSSVRSRKKSLESQAKKELSHVPAVTAKIKVTSRVSDLKSRFDSAPIQPAVVAARRAEQAQPVTASHVSTMKITLDRGSPKKGNKSFCC